MIVTTTDYETLFRAWYPRLVSLGTSMTGRRDVAGDVAQEALLRAHRNWAEVATYEHPGAWVRKVAVNLLIDYQRSVKRERAAVDRLSDADALTTPGPAASRWSELTGDLPARQRQIVTLYYADDQSVGDIAELLGLSTGAVKASLFKARRSIQSRQTPLDSEARDV